MKKHDLDLADAPQVIESGATVTFEDHRFDYDETRYVTIGPLRGVLVVLVTVEDADDIRIISMRKATRHEKEIYQDHI